MACLLDADPVARPVARLPVVIVDRPLAVGHGV